VGESLEPPSEGERGGESSVNGKGWPGEDPRLGNKIQGGFEKKRGRNRQKCGKLLGEIKVKGEGGKKLDMTWAHKPFKKGLVEKKKKESIERKVERTGGNDRKKHLRGTGRFVAKRGSKE